MLIRDVLAASGLAKKAPFHLVDCGRDYTSPYCCFISQAELELWLGERREPAAGDNLGAEELGVYLPDVYASDFYFQEERCNRLSTMAYMRMINDLLDFEIERYELAFAAFALLHEYGHWLHFRRCHKGRLDYVLWLNRYLAPVESQRELLEMIPNDEQVKEQLVLEHIDAYNAMPQELSANKYALKHVAALYHKLLKLEKKQEQQKETQPEE